MLPRSNIGKAIVLLIAVILLLTVIKQADANFAVLNRGVICDTREQVVDFIKTMTVKPPQCGLLRGEVVASVEPVGTHTHDGLMHTIAKYTILNPSWVGERVQYGIMGPPVKVQDA